MKKEITEYYCDVCGKKVDKYEHLELIKFLLDKFNILSQIKARVKF